MSGCHIEEMERQKAMCSALGVDLAIKVEPNPPITMELFAEGVCWRCAGKGYITMDKDKDTPCGACLGTKIPPKPCPECGSPKAKVMYDGMTVCWWCRDCGYRGPDHLDSREAMKAWNELPREKK